MNEFLQKFREQYPQYGDLSDTDLARRLHGRFYSDMEWDDFAGRIGLADQGQPADIPAEPQQTGGRLTEQAAFSPAVQDRREGMDLGETARMALQAVPLAGEFSDEVIGDTERVQEIRSKFPVRTLLMEFLAGLAIPGIAVTKAAKAGPLAQAATGAATGGTEGFIEGVGAGEGGALERATGLPALLGGGLGAALGGTVGTVAGAAAARRTRTGAPIRAAEALEEGTGVRTRPVTQAFPSEIKGQRQDLSRVYQDLADEFPEIDDPDILDFINDLRGREGFNYAVSLELPREGSPSFDQLKNLRTRLSGMSSDEAQQAAEVLTRKMDDFLADASAFENNILAPNFQRLRQRYARNLEAMEALEEGRRMAERPAFDVRQRLDELTARLDEVGERQVREAFRAGQVSRAVEKLTRRESGSPALLKRMMDAGPDTSTYQELRNYFPPGFRGDVAMEEFRAFLSQERSAAEAAAKFDRVLKRAATVGAVGLLGAAGANYAGGLLGGNQ